MRSTHLVRDSTIVTPTQAYTDPGVSNRNSSILFPFKNSVNKELDAVESAHSVPLKETSVTYPFSIFRYKPKLSAQPSFKTCTWQVASLITRLFCGTRACSSKNSEYRSWLIVKMLLLLFAKHP